MNISKLHSTPDIGLLILRAAFGIYFMANHGYSKISGGPELWNKLGSAMGDLALGIPVFWGFMAAFAEFFGALFITLGILFVPANLILAITMFVAANKHLGAGDPFSKYVTPLMYMLLCVGFAFTGPGKFSLDYIMKRKSLLSPSENL